MNFIQKLYDDGGIRGMGRESDLGLDFALGGESKVGNATNKEGGQQLSLHPGTFVGALCGHGDVEQGFHRGDLVAITLGLAHIGITVFVEETHLDVSAATLLDVFHPAHL